MRLVPHQAARPTRVVALVSALALSAGLLAVVDGPRTAGAQPTVTATAKKAATTSKLEKRRSKGVKTPKLSWYSCYGDAKCATVKVPLDYDKPNGKMVELAVLKVPAR